MPKTLIRIATRKSVLALWQANYVKELLEQNHPGVTIELVGITTTGDQIIDKSLAKIGGKGLFLKELEHALLTHAADIAVHSMKDVPAEVTPELCIAAICKRAEVRDAFVSNRFATVAELPSGAVVGTSSLRRQAQLLAFRPDLQIKTLRGNVDTRLRKLDNQEFDAIILAAAGLQRLGLQHRISQLLPIDFMLPAVGQGAVGIECRNDDKAIQQLLTCLHDPITYTCLQAERAVTQRLMGGCHVPIAAYANYNNGSITLRALVGTPNGKKIISAQGVVNSDNAIELGTDLAEQLLTQGAQQILQELDEYE